MALPTTYRFNVQALPCHTASCGSTPIPAYLRIPYRCEIQSFSAVTHTSTSVADTIVTVALNGTTITSNTSTSYMNLTVAAAGPGNTATGAPQAKTFAVEGDYLAFTAASGTGSAVPATYHAILRAI